MYSKQSAKPAFVMWTKAQSLAGAEPKYQECCHLTARMSIIAMLVTSMVSNSRSAPGHQAHRVLQALQLLFTLQRKNTKITVKYLFTSYSQINHIQKTISLRFFLTNASILPRRVNNYKIIPLIWTTQRKKGNTK